MENGHILVDAVEERCILVGVITQKMTEELALEYFFQAFQNVI